MLSPVRSRCAAPSPPANNRLRPIGQHRPTEGRRKRANSAVRCRLNLPEPREWINGNGMRHRQDEMPVLNSYNRLSRLGLTPQPRPHQRVCLGAGPKERMERVVTATCLPPPWRNHVVTWRTAVRLQHCVGQLRTLSLMAALVILIVSLPHSVGAISTKVDEDLNGIGSVNISAMLNAFQLGYDKRVRPNYGGKAVTVGVSMFVLSISELSEVGMDFTLDMYFRQFWRDPRLQFERRKNLERLVVGSEYINLIWTPDTFFVNEKTAYFHKATTENQFLRILHTGEILRSIRLTITASCPMDLQYFPMDSQLCYIEIESFGYTMNDIRYEWNDGLNSVQVSGDVSLPQFKVLGHRQKTIEASLSTGNYSRLACEIQFVRSMGYYLIQIYIPSSLIVVISWVSFWLNRGATPARVGLGVTTVLTMTTLISSTNSALPKISYVKSIDVYLAACFFMVFASLIEYASVGYMAKRIQMRKNRFLAIQKMAEQKKNEALHASNANIHEASTNLDNMPKQTEIRMNMQQQQQHHDRRAGPVITNSIMRTTPNNRLIPGAFHQDGAHAQGNNSTGPGPAKGPVRPEDLMLHQVAPPLLHCKKNLQKIGGISPSDIDKYSRVLFPVSFICFNLMYWIIYLNISEEVVPDLVLLGSS